MSISIVIPFHNEEKNVEATVSKLHQFFKSNNLKGEIIAINDRSKDGTGKILDGLSKRFKILKVVHRKGDANSVEVGYAIRDGIKTAKSDIVTIMMGDLSDNPDDIMKMAQKIEEGYDIVCGSRFIKGSKMIGYPPLKNIMVRLYNTLFSLAFCLPIKDFSNAFKSYRRDVFKKIKLESKEFEITAEMLLKAHIYGYRIAEVPVSWVNRKSGVSKLGAFDFSAQFLFLKLPRIGLRYGTVALKLYFIYLINRIAKILG